MPSPPTNDALVTKLVQAGTTLEFLKYAQQLFEMTFVGGLLQPGGSYLDDKMSPFYIIQDTAELGSWDPVVGMVEVLQRVIQRYRYLQRPLEDQFLPDLLGYIAKWNPEQRAKLAQAIALLCAETNIQPKCLISLTKDHVVKDNVALDFITIFFRTYLTKQKIDHLAAQLRGLKKGGLNDILQVFPRNMRDQAHLTEHFKRENLTPIVDWYAKFALSEIKDETIAKVKTHIEDEDSNETIVEYLRTQQAERPVPEADLCEWIVAGWMAAFDFTARADQLDKNVVEFVKKLAPTLEPFTESAKAQIGILNFLQVFCYTETRILKAYLGLVKVLYDADCVSEEAIIYWYTKGAKPQGKGHFQKVMEPFVKFLEEESDDE